MTAPAARVHDVDANALVSRVAHEQQALRTRFVGMLALAGGAAAAVVAAVGAWMLADSRWLALPRGLPLLVWALGAALAVGAVYWMRRQEGDKQSLKSIAMAIETEQGLRKGSLRGALEVGNQGVFGRFAAQNIAAKLSQTETLVPQTRGKLGQRLAIAGGAAAVGAVLLVLSARTASDGFAAVVHPVDAWRGLLLPALGFPGLPSSVPRGMPLTLHIAAEGRSTVTLSRRAPGEAWVDTTLQVDPKTGQASFALGPVRAPIALRATDGRAPAAEVTLSIGDRGWVGEVSMQAIYPAYLGRSNETLEAVSPLRVPRGTVLVVSAEQHGGARDAVMSSGKDTVRFAATSDTAKVEARFTADHDGTWHWTAGTGTKSAGVAVGASMLPEVPEDLALVIAPDAVPQVAILSPMSDTAIGTSGTLPLAFEALDDHGVTKIMLTVWREPAADVGKTVRTSEVKRDQLLVAQPDSPVWGGQGGLPLAGQNLEPGDRLHLVAVATDNSLWHQTGESAELVLRVPSIAEQRDRARDLGDSIAAQAQRLATAEKKLQQSTAEASKARDLKGGNAGQGEQSNGGEKGAKGKEGTMSFAAAERTKQVSRDQRELSAKLDSMKSSAKELEQRLRDAGALDTALAKRMQDVQKMLREAMTPEMQKQLQNLDNASERLSGTEAQKSMEQLAAQQQQMREQLDKSAEMLKRAAMEGTMETLRDEARDLADAQQKLADKQSGKPGSSAKPSAANKSNSTPDKGTSPQREMSAKEMAERTKDLEREVEALAKKLEQQGAKPGAEHARQAEKQLEQGADAADKAAREAGADQQQQEANAKRDEELAKAMGAQQGKSQKPGEQGKADQQKAGGQQQGQQQGGQQQGQQQGGQQGGQQQGQQQGGQQQGQQSGGQQSGGQQQAGGQPGSSAQQAANAMDRAADQLAQARESQVDAWKNELSQQLDQSINETMQLAKQQSALEDRMKKQGANAQGMQGEQGAIQQGVQQAAQRLEQAGRQSSLLSQRSQKAMADAAKRSEQATKAAGQSQNAGGSEQTQQAMKDATEALNQALSSLVRDREKVNSAESASGFSEMMEQLKKLGQQQGNLNSAMQGLNMLPGGAQGAQAQQQARQLAKQQREVARSLDDVADADASGRMEQLAKEAQQVAQALERTGPDPTVASRQQQLYRRLLDAGKFLEKDERDDEGPREAKTGDNTLSKVPADGPQSGKAANKFAAPTWNELRGLGAEERRLVLEYFRRLNSKP